MKPRKILVIGILVMLLLAGLAFVIFERSDMGAKKSLDYFSQLIEDGKADNLSLTIYYVNPWILTLMPLDVNLLIANYADDIVYVENLKEQIDLFKQINSDALIPVEHTSRMDARVYYVFKTKHNRKIFDVAMWGDDYSIYVNGLEVKSDDIFYDIIMPFLPEHMAINLEANKNDAKTASHSEQI